MSATDELRRMLTEAGVEWDYGITGALSTRFNANGVELTFIDMRDGVTCSTILTPEQAIAATVGDTDATPTRQGDADLEAENAKLRELLADTLMQPRDYCHKYGIEYESWDSANAHLDARMRELGVEVPDGD